MYTQLDLACIENKNTRIGLIGSSFFAGWAFSSFIIPRLADVYGRRVTFIYSMVLQTLAFIGVIFSRDINITTVLMFFMGIAAPARTTIGFLYLMELLPAKSRPLAAISHHFVASFVNVVGCLYFWLISKNWRWLEIMACFIGLIACLGACIMPESPKFYISNKKYDEARQAVNKIAKWNNTNEFHGEFDTEV